MNDNFCLMMFCLACLFIGLVFGGALGEHKGNVDVASGKVVCQQALGQWVCKAKDEVK